MKLIGSTTSPYVRKVRVVLAEKKLECQFVAEDVWAAGSAIAQTNPLGQVPTLVLLKSGEAVYDSCVIVEYLDTLSPLGKLIPPPGRERLAVKTWEALADGMLNAGVLARLERTWPGRETAQRSEAWAEWQLAKIDKGLAEMSRLLGDKPFCCGIHLSLADIAAGCLLGWLSFRFPEIGWREQYANLAQLQIRLEERPSFADTMPG